MKIGLFDHIDRSGDRPIAQQFDERLEFISTADKAGYYCYHLAEHHATPLNMVPVPGVFLGAVARCTQRIHLGPMVYLLPFLSPLRVIEEMAILDHLSHGRLEVGVGRGTSPFEMNFHKIDYQQARELFIDTYECVVEGITHDRLTYDGAFHTYSDVPMAMRPLQRPHPPFWYGTGTAIGSAWAGAQGMNFTTTGSVEVARNNIAAFSAALAERGGAAVPNPDFSGGAAISVMREIYVAETDAEARRIAKPAHDHLYANQTYLRRENARGRAGDVAISAKPTTRAGDFDEAIREGSIVIGSPETVLTRISELIEELGINYLIGYFMFGTLTLADALRSLALFTSEVKPKLDRLGTLPA